jgi:F-type H+-transporting ATPase subunit c
MRALRLLALVLVAFFVAVMPVMAQETKDLPHGTFVLSGKSVGAGLGAALTIIGAGYGFGRIGSSALEGMARQPEVAGNIQTGMIIIAALLEGATFFSLIVCILLATGTQTL